MNIQHLWSPVSGLLTSPPWVFLYPSSQFRHNVRTNFNYCTVHIATHVAVLSWDRLCIDILGSIQSLKGTLAWDFFVPVLCTDQTYIGQIIRLMSVFDFVLEFADLFEIFNIWQWLSWRRVSFPVNWVNAKWDSMSTESTRNDEILVNVSAFCIDSVDVESHSVLTQLTWSLTPRWLSWRGVSLLVDSVCGREIKPKQSYIPSSGAFKGIGYRKIIHEMFKWDQYQLENA